MPSMSRCLYVFLFSNDPIPNVLLSAIPSMTPLSSVLNAACFPDSALQSPIQSLHPLGDTTNQESPTSPKCRQSALILRPRLRRKSKRSTERKSQGPHDVPKPDVPSYRIEWADVIPRRLCLQHEQHASIRNWGMNIEVPCDDETTSSDNLGSPIDSIDQCRIVLVYHVGNTSDGGYPKHGSSKELNGACDESDFPPSRSKPPPTLLVAFRRRFSVA
jgi:hypothetical protein